MNKYGYDLEDPDTIDEILYRWEVLEDEQILLYFTKVVKCPIGWKYRITWTSGLTGCYLDCKMVEVKPVETITTVYVEDKD